MMSAKILIDDFDLLINYQAPMQKLLLQEDAITISHGHTSRLFNDNNRLSIQMTCSRYRQTQGTNNYTQLSKHISTFISLSHINHPEANQGKY